METLRLLGKCQRRGILSGSRFLNCTLLVGSYSDVHGKNREWAVGSIMTWITSETEGKVTVFLRLCWEMSVVPKRRALNCANPH